MADIEHQKKAAAISLANAFDLKPSTASAWMEYIASRPDNPPAVESKAKGAK